MSIEQHWPLKGRALSQVQRFNDTLKRLPRFRIRRPSVAVAIQALLRVGQVGGVLRLLSHGLRAEQRKVVVEGHAVTVRIIRPKGASRGVVLDIHGGGWVIGNAQMNDSQNIALVNTCQVTLVSVEYRLAPATPLEGLMEDCLTAARWLLGEPAFAGQPVMVVGESAGAHLAAGLLLQLKGWPALLARIQGVVLYYGVYDFTGTPSVRAAGADTLVLDGPGLVEALRTLTPGMTDAGRQHAPLSPLYGDFTGLPPALMFVGELDPLLDDTLELARRWAPCAPVEAYRVPACPHGFIHFPTTLAHSVLAYSRSWIDSRLAD